MTAKQNDGIPWWVIVALPFAIALYPLAFLYRVYRGARFDMRARGLPRYEITIRDGALLLFDGSRCLDKIPFASVRGCRLFLSPYRRSTGSNPYQDAVVEISTRTKLHRFVEWDTGTWFRYLPVTANVEAPLEWLA